MRFRGDSTTCSPSHTKAVFNDEKDRLLIGFKNQWDLKVFDCVKNTTEQMKKMIQTFVFHGQGIFGY